MQQPLIYMQMIQTHLTDEECITIASWADLQEPVFSAHTVTERNLRNKGDLKAA